MAQWWESLSVLQHVFLYAAIPFTVILVIQTVLMLLGLSGHDSDADGDADTDADIDAHFDSADAGGLDAHDAHSLDAHDTGEHGGDHGVGGFRFFTIRGIVAFFCIFGWTGYALGDASMHAALTIAIAAASGLAAMLLIGLLFYVARRMQSSGNLNYANAVGQSAQVYLPIPAQRGGRGKVMVQFQERLVEAEAVTDNSERIKTGETVTVTGAVGSTLIVKK